MTTLSDPNLDFIKGFSRPLLLDRNIPQAHRKLNILKTQGSGVISDRLRIKQIHRFPPTCLILELSPNHFERVIAIQIVHLALVYREAVINR